MQAEGTTLLIQFARSPQKGQVKTRMMPHLTAGDACQLHCDLTQWTCRQLLDSALGEVQLSVAGDTDHSLFQQCRNRGATLSQQSGSDLGERMYNALRDGLEAHRDVILVGSDCPAINPAYLQRAVFALAEAPLVFGPAVDGGYVLIAARQITPLIFRDIPWGTSEVYARTREAMKQGGLSWAELPPLADIDRPEDLPVWEAFKQHASRGNG